MRGPALGGIGLALGGVAALSVNDVAVKALSGGYPLHQVVLARSAVGLVVILLLMAATGATPRTGRPGVHALRASVVVLSNALYFLGLATLPLAEGVAIAFVAPLLLTALSVPLLGERVGPRRWAAVAVGLTGVVVMMRPGAEAVRPAALLVLGGAAAYALMHILTRRMVATEGALAMNFWTQVAFIAVASTMGLWAGDGRWAPGSDGALDFLLRAWVVPAAADWPLLVATGLAVSLGGLMLAQAYRTCEAGLIAPFEYAGMPLAILWGVLAFGTWPDATAWAGMALICGAGLYAAWRETRRPA